jgi:hypothetical protein
VNTDDLTALGTGPPFLFAFNEMPYAELPDVLQIVDHAHAILGSIALIQMVQPGAGKAFTTEAVPDSALHYHLTVFDSTRDAGFRFDTVVASATKAWFLISCVCAAEAAIHSTGSDQRRSNCIYLYRSSQHHVRISAKACIVIPF